jgi:hypothetical protein
MIVVCGTYREDWHYDQLNIVALNGSSFIAKCNDPGPCPGDNWQLIASHGKPGKPGLKGDCGERGLPGITTVVTTAFKGWKIDRESYTISPILADGSEGSPLHLRALFEQYDGER